MGWKYISYIENGEKYIFCIGSMYANYEIKNVNMNAYEFEHGSLESTQAGKEFLALNMFEPGFEMIPEKVHELWCILEQKFAESTEGKVTIYAHSIVEGSVFEIISIPASL